MGGYGSTRWGWHRKKAQVEAALKLRIQTIKPGLIPGYSGWVSWSVRGEVTDRIGYRVLAGELGQPDAIRLEYTTTRAGGDKTDYNYLVSLTTTLTPWGSRRYWFVCPLIANGQPCARRVGVLHLPPGGRYFGCRHCYNLAYRSSQEQHGSDGFYRMMAAEMQADHPGITAADMRYIWGGLIAGRNLGKLPPAGGYYAQEIERRRADLIADLLAQEAQRYADYLTAGDLCEQAGLSADDLARLEAARLLLPDHENRYRPKLAGWARKLAYLLAVGPTKT